MARYTEEDVDNEIAVVNEQLRIRTREITHNPPPTRTASGRPLRTSNLSPISSLITQRLQRTIDEAEHDSRLAILTRQRAIANIEQRLSRPAAAQAERDRKRKREVAEAKEEFGAESHSRRSPHVRIARSPFHSPLIAAAAAAPDDEPGAPPPRYAPPGASAEVREGIERRARQINRQLFGDSRLATYDDYVTWFNHIDTTCQRRRPHFDQPATAVADFVSLLDRIGSGLSAEDRRKIIALLANLYEDAAKAESSTAAVHKWYICYFVFCPLWWPVRKPRVFSFIEIENIFSQKRRLNLGLLRALDPVLGPRNL